MWNGGFFAKITLAELGLTIQLNHIVGDCPNAVRCHQNFLVMDTSGPHRLNILYCDCERRLPHHIQLLRRRLYLATQDVVQTCATFRYLDFVNLHSLTAKGSTLGFYQTMERIWDNTGLSPTIWQYPALKLMLNQWRHLHMLKRGGRGHDPSDKRIAETKSADLAIRCPSCPRPGINLHSDYIHAPAEDQ